MGDRAHPRRSELSVVTAPGPTPADLLALAIDIGREAGAFVASRRDAIASLDTKSSTTDIVTDVDRASEELIVNRILAARPDDGVVGEEGAGIVGLSGIEWVIDPIDGTTSFVYGYPGWCVSIAVARTGGTPQTVAGVVVDPTHDHLYSAALGSGAHRNGLPISASSLTELQGALVGTGFSYDGARRAQQAAVLEQVLPEVRDIRRSGSAALDLCYAATGQIDAYYEVGLNRWDQAAGLLIAAEAGAETVSETPSDKPPFTVAAGAGIATALGDLLERSNARLRE